MNVWLGSNIFWKSEKTYPLSRLLREFDPAEVAEALGFLWELKLKHLNFAYHSYNIKNENTRKFSSLLDAPQPDETKMDQLIRWLEERKAYRKKPAGSGEHLK